MKTRVACALYLALCAACVSSLHPLYTSEDLVYEAALEGLWLDPDSEERWNFQRAGESGYRLVISDEDSWGAFEAHLLKTGDHYFLDLFPADWTESVNSVHRANLLPVHVFLAVRELSPRLEMATVDGGWLKDYLAAHPDALAHEIVDDEIVLTARPRAMQAFLIAHMSAAFSDYGVLERAP